MVASKRRILACGPEKAPDRRQLSKHSNQQEKTLKYALLVIAILFAPLIAVAHEGHGQAYDVTAEQGVAGTCNGRQPPHECWASKGFTPILNKGKAVITNAIPFPFDGWVYTVHVVVLTQAGNKEWRVEWQYSNQSGWLIHNQGLWLIGENVTGCTHIED